MDKKDLAKEVARAAAHDLSLLRNFTFREPPPTVVAQSSNNEELIVVDPIRWNSDE